MSTWTYRDNLSAGQRDLVGYQVEATDGSIGKIDEASDEAGAAYVVVDTGFWIFGKKRMIPAGVIDRINVDAQTVYVRMTKDQIKDAPDFDETNRDNRSSYDTYYRVLTGRRPAASACSPSRGRGPPDRPWGNRSGGRWRQRRCLAQRCSAPVAATAISERRRSGQR